MSDNSQDIENKQEIVVTEAMIDAGLLVLARYDFDMSEGLGHDPELVEGVLRAGLKKMSLSF